jgi:hypothetical protein
MDTDLAACLVYENSLDGLAPVLGGFYRDHPDFRARYGGRSAGLADYMAEAMRAFADTRLI